MSADCHICATVQSPVGNQREPVVRHDEATWHLKEYRELAAREMLITLCRHASDDVCESAAESLLDLYKGDALNILAPLLPDEAIARAVAEHDTR